MGDFETGTRFARDGKTVIKDDVQFGMEWQVKSSEPQLVESAAPAGKCVSPNLAVQADRRRLHGSEASRDAANAACAHLKQGRAQCFFDVLATNDLSLADGVGAF